MRDLIRNTRRLAVWLATLTLPALVQAQSETIFFGVGMDTPSASFAQASMPGATGIDFRLMIAIAPAFPETETHPLVVDFEWGSGPAGPWTASPDNVASVVGGATRFFDTGVYHGPSDAPWVRLHFYAGGLMTVSGTFTHTSAVPEPPAALLLTVGALALAWRRRTRQSTAESGFSLE